MASTTERSARGLSLVAAVTLQLLALVTSAHACSFPGECDQFALPGKLQVDRLLVAGQTLSFTVRATVPDPTAGARTVCPKVVDTIRINSFGTCIKSEVHAYQGTTALNTPVFVSSDDQVYLSIQLNMTWAEIFANPPNITLILGARPGVRKCNWWQQPIKGPKVMARSWHMLNTTAVSPIDMAFASPGGGKCCPRPTVIIELPDGQLPDPNQAAPCKACSTMLVAVDNNMLLLERTRALCLDLAVLLNSNPALTGLMPPGNLSFACNTDMPVSASGTQMQFQACAGGQKTEVNTYVNNTIAILDLFSALVGQELGPRLGLSASSSCAYVFLVSSSCGQTQSAQGICPQMPEQSPAPAGDTSWNFPATSKAQAMAQAQVLSTTLGVPVSTDPSKPPPVGSSNNVSATVTNKKLKAMFADWCNTYELAQPTDKAAFRNFKNNIAHVLAINLDPNVTWWASGNRFSHLSPKQFSKLYLGGLSPRIAHGRRSRFRILLNDVNVTASIPASTPAPTPGNQQPEVAAAGFDWTFPTFNFPPFNFPGFPTPTPTPTPQPVPAPSPRPSPIPSPQPSHVPSPAPIGINWVTMGKVTPVKDQGPCGACWAFVSTGLIESAYLISGRGSPSTLDLSEEQLLSCVNPNNSPYNGYGCDGGWVDNGVNYVYWASQTKEAYWPFSGAAQTCRPMPGPDTGNSVKLSSGAQQVSPARSEQALKNALMNSPASVYWMADSSLQNYRGGIFSSSTCTASVNHAMLVVGWGYDSGSGSYYWLLKNSWSTTWGESGYVRVKMTGDGAGPCGMLQWAYQAPINAFSSTPLSGV